MLSEPTELWEWGRMANVSFVMPFS